jgi:hypothetical protein
MRLFQGRCKSGKVVEYGHRFARATRLAQLQICRAAGIHRRSTRQPSRSCAKLGSANSSKPALTTETGASLSDERREQRARPNRSFTRRPSNQLAHVDSKRGETARQASGCTPVLQRSWSKSLVARNLARKRNADLLARQIATDPHAPSKFRVNGSMRNLPEFAEALACSPGSALAPVDRCQLW